MVVVNLEKRHLFLLVAIGIFLVGVGIVVSSDIDVEREIGHSISNIFAPDFCKGKFLKWAEDGSGWNCEVSSVVEPQFYTTSQRCDTFCEGLGLHSAYAPGGAHTTYNCFNSNGDGGVRWIVSSGTGKCCLESEADYHCRNIGACYCAS